MGYILYHIPSKRRIKWFLTERGAMSTRTDFNRNACDWEYDVINDKDFNNKYNGGSNPSATETFADPSTELFWSTS